MPLQLVCSRSTELIASAIGSTTIPVIRTFQPVTWQSNA